jgi:site-specific recombinase XerD
VARARPDKSQMWSPAALHNTQEYHNHRRRQPSQRNPKTTVKGPTVNREIQCLHCIFQFAITRKYIAENPAAGVRHFDERRERPAKQMWSVVEEQLIFESAPAYSEGLSLRWHQVDLENLVIHLAVELKTRDSAQPVPLTRQACDLLRE